MWSARKTTLPGLAVMLAIVALAGCTPADPLDWKVKADTPDDYNGWIAEVGPLLPQPLANEFNQAMGVLMARHPTAHGMRSGADMRSTHDPFCLLVNRRKVRDVIIEGYQSANEELQNSISRDQENLLANLKRSAETSADDPLQARLAIAIGNERKMIDYYKEQMGKNDTRIAELEGRPSPAAKP